MRALLFFAVHPCDHAYPEACRGNAEVVCWFPLAVSLASTRVTLPVTFNVTTNFTGAADAGILGPPWWLLHKTMSGTRQSQDQQRSQ